MAKLFFRYGAMGSSKTANALMVEYNYRERGKRALLAKPQTDTRDGELIIKSRIGLERPCVLVETILAMPDEALKEYGLAIKFDPSYDIAYNNMGVIYLDDLGRVKQAADLFKKSIECNPNYALAHFNLARAIAITGDKIEAAKLYQVAQDINKITNEIDPQDILDKINALFE